MTKSIKMTEPQWTELKQRLTKDYVPSIMLIRTKMHNVLGFTPRDHRYYDQEKFEYKHFVYLDFFNDPKKTMFMLKYSEYFDKSELD